MGQFGRRSIAYAIIICLFLAGIWLAGRYRTPPAVSDAAPTTPAQEPAALPTTAPPAAPTRTAVPTPSPAPAPSPTAVPTLSTIQALERAEMPARDPIALAERFVHSGAPISPIAHATPPAYRLGDRDVFWITDEDAGVHYAVTATLRYISDHLYMWVEDGFDIPEADLRRSAERFDKQIYPTNRDFFGSEWTPGVDSDPRIHVFNGAVPGVAGYFYSPSEFPRAVNPYSNEREVFFINLNARRPGTDAYDATLAHEFQHMIQWHVDRNEDAWMNEGLSVLAEHLNGFAVSHYIQAYLQDTDTQLTAWAIGDESPYPHYGAGFLFLEYTLERLGQPAFQHIIRSPANGPAAFDAVLTEMGLPERFETLFADWTAAVYLDSAGGMGVHQHQELALDAPEPAVEHRAYPAQGPGTVRPYGVDYILLEGGAGEDLRLHFRGVPETRLAPMSAHSGRWMWWSNRGDDSSSSLTRAFDLRGVATATLQAWLWYDIEPDWDYAYAEVSTDGGRSWQILAGRHTVTTNPHGNSFGPAYTGKSGGEMPVWVQEEIDLTPFAGQVILLRFELTTDDSVNHPGLFLDDIRIPEIGYVEDFEQGGGGWEAQGFIRTDNVLPQRYLVQVLAWGEDGTPTVTRLELDEAQIGMFLLEGLGRRVRRAVLAISALAPATTEPAPYWYSLTPAE
ncbi:MAG: hypothetical protein ACUVT1_02505 [Anaerolineae bacterium]